MSELPKGWTSTHLGSLSRLVMGQAPSGKDCNMDGVGTVFVKAGEFGKSKPIIREWTTSPLKFAQKGDILICVVGATAGKINLAIDCSIGRSVAAIRPATEIQQKYIYYFLAGQVENLRKGSTGSAQGVISKPDLVGIAIPLAPATEQIRIAQKLDELLAQIDTLKARIDAIPTRLKRFRQSVLAAAVSGRLTEEWRGGKEYCAESLMLADLVDNSLVGLVRSSAEQSESADQRVPYLKMNNIGNDWGVSLDLLVYVSVSEAETERYSLKDGDWLFNTRNSQELVGKSCVWRGGSRPFVFNNNILRARFSGRTAPDFIEIWFRSPSGREALEKVKSATTSVAAVYQKALMSQMVPLPEIAEQTEIVRRVEQLFAFADQLESKVASAKSRIDHLTQSILAKAFRGELVPQDPNDEPASVLLERIKAQRAAAPKAKRGRKVSTR
ncbi:restriction endonuclease subunit S [Stutzerimonas nitrititolerans]|uniref:restriction endonuclease subunit S n=1 Tax=Stutzerimonas nitrititolerans TaxID=2482751 RepID=UPI0015E3478E|nr:restriction endonuclease subunit S [Stutzerimonas nitrititolerans]